MMIETAKMSERGQIIIPKDIREHIGATENTIFTVSTLDDDTIVMKKLDTEKLVKEFREMRARTLKVPQEEIDREIHAARKEIRAGH